jgi:hypothetical protein
LASLAIPLKNQTKHPKNTFGIFSLWELLEGATQRFLRRGRGASGDDPELDLEIDETETDDLRNFLDAPAKGPLWDTVASNHKKITKYLAPGTVMDLFAHYQSTRQLFGSVAVSSFGRQNVFQSFLL